MRANFSLAAAKPSPLLHRNGHGPIKPVTACPVNGTGALRRPTRWVAAQASKGSKSDEGERRVRSPRNAFRQRRRPGPPAARGPLRPLRCDVSCPAHPAHQTASSAAGHQYARLKQTNPYAKGLAARQPVLLGSCGADAMGASALRNDELEALLKLFLSLAAMRAQQQLRTAVQLSNNLTSQLDSASGGQGTRGPASAGTAPAVPSDSVRSAALRSEAREAAADHRSKHALSGTRAMQQAMHRPACSPPPVLQVTKLSALLPPLLSADSQPKSKGKKAGKASAGSGGSDSDDAEETPQEAVRGAGKRTADAVEDAGEQVADAVEDAASDAADAVEALQTAAEDAQEQVAEAVDEAASDAAETAASVQAAAEDAGQQVADAVQDAASEAADAAASAQSTLAAAGQQAVESALEAASDVASEAAGIAGAVQSAAQAVSDKAAEAAAPPRAGPAPPPDTEPIPNTAAGRRKEAAATKQALLSMLASLDRGAAATEDQVQRVGTLAYRLERLGGAVTLSWERPGKQAGAQGRCAKGQEPLVGGSLRAGRGCISCREPHADSRPTSLHSYFLLLWTVVSWTVVSGFLLKHSFTAAPLHSVPQTRRASPPWPCWTAAGASSTPPASPRAAWAAAGRAPPLVQGPSPWARSTKTS